MRDWGGTCLCGHSHSAHGERGAGDIIYGSKCFGGTWIKSCQCREYQSMDEFIEDLNGPTGN